MAQVKIRAGIRPGDVAWTDAATLYPTMFDSATFSGGILTKQPKHVNTFSPGTPNSYVTHMLMAYNTGLYDNFEVSVRWRPDLTQAGFTHQVSPVAFVDLNSTDPLQMGVLPIWDVSVNATYIQNAFRESPISDVPNNAYYVADNTSINNGMPAGITDGGPCWVSLKCENGKLSYSFDGVVLKTGRTIPAWASGRTWMGIHVIGFDWPVGADIGFVLTEQSPVIVDMFRVVDLS